MRYIAVGLIVVMALASSVYGSGQGTGWEELVEAAELQSNSGELAEADRLLSEALAVTREIVDNREPELRVLQSRGALLERLDRHQEASELFFGRFVLLVLTDRDPAELYNAMGQLAATYEKTGRFEEALSLRRAAYELLRRRMSDFFRASALYALANHHRMRRQYVEAERYLLQAVQLLRSSQEPIGNELAYALGIYADLLFEIGREAEASEIRSEAEAASRVKEAR